MANAELNRKLLELAGFEGDEVDEILEDWLFTVEAVGLSDEDIRYALEEYIPQNWDVKYRGVRKMIGAYLREMIGIAKTKQYKAEGKKLLYGILPAVVVPYTAYKYAGGDNIYVSFPDLMLVTILNGFFHKAAPYLLDAEAQGFTYGCRHCPLNKMRVGAFSKGLLAAPDVIWSWGFNCDEGPKTDEMIQCMMGEEWKYIVSRIPHDTMFGEADDEYERVKYMADVLKDAMDEISSVIGITPSEEDMKAALKDNGRYTFKIGTLVSLVCKSDPVPLGGNTLTQFQQGLTVPFNFGLKYLEEALDILIKELRAAVKDGIGRLRLAAPAHEISLGTGSAYYLFRYKVAGVLNNWSSAFLGLRQLADPGPGQGVQFLQDFFHDTEYLLNSCFILASARLIHLFPSFFFASLRALIAAPMAAVHCGRGAAMTGLPISFSKIDRIPSLLAAPPEKTMGSIISMRADLLWESMRLAIE